MAKKQSSASVVVIFLQVVVMLFAGSQTIASQDEQAVTSPLRVTTQGLLGLDRGCKAGEGLIVQLHYTGEKPLRGHVLRFENADAKAGKPLNDEILEEVRGLREPVILSGQEWTRIISESGTTIRRVSTKELETQGNPSAYLAPGQTWVADPRKFSYLPDGSLASYKITLDLVVFADGSIFGPMKSQESAEVLGMVDGIDDARRISQDATGKKSAEKIA